MTTHRGAGGRLDADVLVMIQKLADDAANFSARQILTKLEEDLPNDKKLPDVRTVQRIVRERRPIDASGMWSWQSSSPDEAQLILQVLGMAIVRSRGVQNMMTNDDAEWILKIRGVAPSLKPYTVWSLVRLYKMRKALQEDVTDLDTFLALSYVDGGVQLFEEFIRTGEVLPPIQRATLTKRQLETEFGPVYFEGGVESETIHTIEGE